MTFPQVDGGVSRVCSTRAGGTIVSDKASPNRVTWQSAAGALPINTVRSDRLVEPTVTTPTPTSVYRYYDASGVLLYVGITSRATSRQQEHNADKEWWPYVAQQSVEHFPTRRDALTHEKALIRRYRPPFNKQHNPDHEVVRMVYLASGLGGNRKARGDRRRTKLTSKDARQIHAACRGRVPLVLVESDRRSATYRVEPGHAPLVAETPFTGPVLLRAPAKVATYSHRYMQDEQMHIVFDRVAGEVPYQAMLRVKIRHPFSFWAHEAVAVA